MRKCFVVVCSRGVTAGDGSGGSPLVVPAVTEPRQSTVDLPPPPPPSVKSPKSPAASVKSPGGSRRVSLLGIDDDSDVDKEFVTALVSNETMKQGAAIV